MKQARQKYALALRLINKALRSPKDVLKNSALLAVLMLAIFETTAGSKQRAFSHSHFHFLTVLP